MNLAILKTLIFPKKNITDYLNELVFPLKYKIKLNILSKNEIKKKRKSLCASVIKERKEKKKK